MKFGWSAETTLEAKRDFNVVATTVARYLDSAFSKPPLDTIDIKIIYVPILMNKHIIDSYPARSRRSIKERIIHCCPQLDFDRWIAGNKFDKVDVWMNGLKDATVYLERFGLPDDQLDAFKACIARRPRPKKKDSQS